MLNFDSYANRGKVPHATQEQSELVAGGPASKPKNKHVIMNIFLTYFLIANHAIMLNE